MKKAFTLIELLVVIVIIAVVMGLVMPVGSKMLQSFQSQSESVQEKHAFKLDHAYAFIEATEKNVTFQGEHYRISSKGVSHKYANSDDDR